MWQNEARLYHGDDIIVEIQRVYISVTNQKICSKYKSPDVKTAFKVRRLKLLENVVKIGGTGPEKSTGKYTIMENGERKTNTEMEEDFKQYLRNIGVKRWRTIKS